MLYTHVVALATLALCVAEDGTKRPARNPGLLHLAHAEHSVGSYVAPEEDSGGSRTAGGSVGGAGPQIFIYGRHPAQVTTRVVSKDSLEELDEDIRQHYQQQQGTPVRYVPNSSFRGLYFDHGRQNLGFSGFKDVPQYTPGHDYPGVPGAPPPALAYPRTYGHFGVAPILYNHQTAHAPVGHGFTRLSTFVGHPIHQSQTPQHTPTSPPSHHQLTGNPVTSSPSHYPLTGHSVLPTPSHYPLTGHTVTPATVNYATPTPYPITPTATPLAHTPSTPLLLPARVPLHHPIHGGVAPVSPLIHNGLSFHSPLGHGPVSPLSHGPVFVPVQAFSHQPHSFFQNQGHPQYSPQAESDGRSHSYKDEQGSEDEERQRYYGDTQERRPNDYQSSHQREYEEEENPAFSPENTNYQKSYGKYESEESLPKSAATPAYQSYPSEDKGSYEDSSNEAGSAEKGPSFKYSFADDHTKGRSSLLGDGEGKVATSYQSVTFETHHPIPRHYPKQKLH